jgi:hypothetical protein
VRLLFALGSLAALDRCRFAARPPAVSMSSGEQSTAASPNFSLIHSTRRLTIAGFFMTTAPPLRSRSLKALSCCLRSGRFMGSSGETVRTRAAARSILACASSAFFFSFAAARALMIGRDLAPEIRDWWRRVPRCTLNLLAILRAAFTRGPIAPRALPRKCSPYLLRVAAAMSAAFSGRMPCFRPN